MLFLALCFFHYNVFIGNLKLINSDRLYKYVSADETKSVINGTSTANGVVVLYENAQTKEHEKLATMYSILRVVQRLGRHIQRRDCVESGLWSVPQKKRGRKGKQEVEKSVRERRVRERRDARGSTNHQYLIY